MHILGINAYHGDSSACLLRDGKLIAAAEEERFRRIKHWAGFPSQAIAYCLKEAGIELGGVDCVAINHDPAANLARKIGYSLIHLPSPKFVIDRAKNSWRKFSIQEQLAQVFAPQTFAGEVVHVEHHLAHLASAFLVSPFADAVAVSIDGFGNFASSAWGLGSGGAIATEGKVYFPHSLGIFYEAMTQYLGFPRYGDEYKVMGLAPYGQPRFLSAMREIVRLNDDGTFALNLEFFRHHREKYAYKWSNGEPQVGPLFSSALAEMLGPARAETEELSQKHRDIARSAQEMFEQAVFHLLNRLYDRYRCANLALAGGCAMNSVANGKVYFRTPFKRVYVQSAAGDAGGAIGAAVVAWGRRGGARAFAMEHAYWGPQFGDGEISALLNTRRQDIAGTGCATVRIDDEETLCQRTAAAIAQGKVVGWFQGRMEWGPRALGGRSILCDPRRADMKDVLNLKIKRRESFRPFAPSILREAVSEWFEFEDDVPFMTQVLQIREDRRGLIPAVTHVDGSGRLQTVAKTQNARYYRLIEAFAGATGVPLVLNTSFNENEPVVCTPEEALACFLRTQMDVLVLEDYVVSRAEF